MIRAVVDTNILVRALIKPQGTVGPVLHRLRERSFLLLYSESLLAELVDVLSRPRIRSKYGIHSDDVAVLLHLIDLRGELVVPRRRIDVCRDPKDNQVLEAAIAGSADVMVTGNDDLLVLHPFEGIPIVIPSVCSYDARHKVRRACLTRHLGRAMGHFPAYIHVASPKT